MPTSGSTCFSHLHFRSFYVRIKSNIPTVATVAKLFSTE
jgi:hypothetical protein